MTDTEIKSAILEELSFSDLDSHQLAARLKVGVSVVKPLLRDLEEEGSIKQVEREESKVWRLP